MEELPDAVRIDMHPSRVAIFAIPQKPGYKALTIGRKAQLSSETTALITLRQRSKVVQRRPIYLLVMLALADYTDTRLAAPALPCYSLHRGLRLDLRCLFSKAQIEAQQLEDRSHTPP